MVALPLGGTDPLDGPRRFVAFEPLEEGRWVLFYEDELPVLPLQEGPVDHLVEDREQRVVVAGDVQQAARLGVLAELGPGQDLEELLEGAVAPGEGDEALRELGHLGLALVNGSND